MSEYEPLDDECIDSGGDPWPEHDYPADSSECRRCGAEAED